MEQSLPPVVFATPRSLPKANTLTGRVVLLDLAFAGTADFDRTTGRLIRELADRLAAWVDHHDHQLHAQYVNDSRFVLCCKHEHGACPEMITPELVQRTGTIDTIVCHDDFDGIFSAAKWILQGNEPYPGADADAHAVDTRTGTVSVTGDLIDRALRARPTEKSFRATVLEWLVNHGTSPDSDSVHHGWTSITEHAQRFDGVERNTLALAREFVLRQGRRTAVLDASDALVRLGEFDKTLALLEGQKLAEVAVIHDLSTVTIAADFHSGIDLLSMLGLRGGMPTRVSVPRARLAEVLRLLDAR